VTTHRPVIEPYLAGDGDSLEIEEDTPAAGMAGARKFFVIAGLFLVPGFVEIVEGELENGVGKIYRDAFRRFSHGSVEEKPILIKLDDPSHG